MVMNHELMLTTEAVAAACCHPLLHLRPDLHVDCESDSIALAAAAVVATTAHVTVDQESMSRCVLVAVAVVASLDYCEDCDPLPYVMLT